MKTIPAKCEFKVYDASGTCQAGCKEPHAAAMLAEHYGGTVRWLHRHVVWKPGDPSPMQSLDTATLFILDACETLKKTRRA